MSRKRGGGWGVGGDLKEGGMTPFTSYVIASRSGTLIMFLCDKSEAQQDKF